MQRSNTIFKDEGDRYVKTDIVSVIARSNEYILIENNVDTENSDIQEITTNSNFQSNINTSNKTKSESTNFDSNYGYN